MKKKLQISDSEGLTFEKVWLMMQENREQQKETAEFIKETGKLQRQTDEQMKKTDEKLNKSIEETKALKQMLFGLGNNLGQITEDYFYNSVADNKTVAGIKYDYIGRNLKMQGKKLNGEYDIILINSKRLLVIEVKQKPHVKDITKFVEKQLPIFKKLFPMYVNYKIYGAIAGMTFSPDAQEFAKENGLYILTQNQESKNVQILNDENFEAKEF